MVYRASAFVVCAFAMACGDTASPTPGGACQAQRDCVVGEVCIAGTCRPLTDAGQPCTPGSCEPNTFCDLADGRCKPVLTMVRDAGFSSPDATPAQDATVAEEDAGFVEPECVSDPDCSPPQQICEQGMCVAGCVAMPDRCAEGTEVCDTNTGRCVPLSVRCMADRDCRPPATICESQQCVPGCGLPGGIQCTGLDGPCNPTTGRCEGAGVCAVDADCMDPDRICVDQRCALRCDRGRPCPSGDACNPADGRCGPGDLPLGDPCQFSAQCATDVCLSFTIGGSTSQLCTLPCSATSQCPLDFTCGELSEMWFCYSETLITPSPAYDTPSGGFCSMDSNTCQSGWCATAANECVEECSRDSDCATFGGQCWMYEFTRSGQPAYTTLCQLAGGQLPGTACTTGQTCRSNICDGGECADLCCSDADCGSDENCVLYEIDASNLTRICAPRSASAGTGVLGSACTSNNQCETELCTPSSIYAPNGARHCSSRCCNHADCSFLGPNGRCRPIAGPIANSLVGVCFDS